MTTKFYVEGALEVRGLPPFRDKTAEGWGTLHSEELGWATRHSAEKTIEKLRYIHRNPVVRGLVSRLEDWPCSSYRHYASGIDGTVEIESFWTAWKREHGGALPHPTIPLIRAGRFPMSPKPGDMGHPQFDQI